MECNESKKLHKTKFLYLLLAVFFYWTLEITPHEMLMRTKLTDQWPIQISKGKESSHILGHCPTHGKHYGLFKSVVGRLGNQLFQIASLLGIATSNCLRVCISSGADELFQQFELDVSKQQQFSINCSSVVSLPTTKLSEEGKFGTYIHFNINKTESTEFQSSYLQSYKYFANLDVLTIKKIFTFKEPILQRAKDLVGEQHNKTLIGVHVRRTDMMKIGYISPPSSSYYIQAMKYFESKYEDAIFYIVSDDPVWCASNSVFQQTNCVVVPSENSAAVDMALLTICHHMIISVGTFGWWSAFLGAHSEGGEVVYYENEFDFGHPIVKGNIKKKDYYPPNWKSFDGSGPKNVCVLPGCHTATLVTAYFEVPSKHSSGEYMSWMENIASVKDPMVIFTTKDKVHLFREFRSHALNTTLIVPMGLHDTLVVKEFGTEFWKLQQGIDPEKRIHQSPLLYVIWNEKTNWLLTASEINPFGSDFFAWIDVGYLRDQKYNGLQLIKKIPQDLKRDQVLMLDVSKCCVGDNSIYTGGGFIGGFHSGIRKWHNKYYNMLRQNRENFVGKDQPWMSRTCTKNQGMCYLVEAVPTHGDPWFYMAPYLHGIAA